MMSSIRTRLLLGTIGGMVLLLLCFAVIVYAAIRQTLLNEFDRSLASTVEILTGGVEVDANGIEVEFGAEQMPQFNDPEHPALYQVWEPGGGVVARSPLLGQADLPRFPSAPGVFTYRAIRAPHTGLPLRAVSIGFTPRIEEDEAGAPSQTGAGQPLLMIVARDVRALQRHLSSLRWLLFGTTVGTAGLALLVGAAVVRRGLHPLRTLATEIAAVNETSLEPRLAAGLAPVEIAPIRDRLNSLLSRLKDAFERERRFSANVAHELRNPLAGMRSTIEVALTRPRESAEYRRVLSECLGIIESMQGLVGNLLLLARLDANQMVFHLEEIRLREMMDCSWEVFSARAVERELAFDNRIPGELILTSDRQSLGLALANLLGNAVEYADRGGRIWIEARATNGSIEIVAANTGCRLRPDQTTHVFDRFWRADASRSDVGAHCGLGLSLVRRIAQALGGSVSATVEHGAFVVHLTLPHHRLDDPHIRIR